jgi:hypothetical protein
MPRLPIKDIGPCVAIWDYNQFAAGSPVCLGPYLGTVTLRWTDSVSDVQEEGYGDAPVDAVFAGSVVELDIPMTRNSIAQLNASIAYGNMGTNYYIDNSTPPVPVADPHVIKLHNMAGCDMYTLARAILIAPICNNVPDTDPHTWTSLFKCHPYRDFELIWDRSGQRVHMVKYKVFPNQDSGYCGEYLLEGLPTSAQAITGICS